MPDAPPRRTRHSSRVIVIASALAAVASPAAWWYAPKPTGPFNRVHDNRAANWSEVTSVRLNDCALVLSDGRWVRYSSQEDMPMVPVMVATIAEQPVSHGFVGVLAELRRDTGGGHRVLVYLRHDYGADAWTWNPLASALPKWTVCHDGSAHVGDGP